MQIYNSLTRKKEEFRPIHEGEVGIYACGPTVYNYFHIGNARPFITFDVLRRQLEREGYKVTFVQNFTDIDDKMIRRANEEGISVKELADRFIAEYYTDARALGIRPATVGLIAAAVVFIAGGVLVKGPLVSAQMADPGYYNLLPICIFGVSILLMSACKIKPIYVILMMAFVGAMLGGFTELM